MNSILIQNTKIEYQLKPSARSNSIRITMYPGGKVVITVGKNLNQELIHKFVLKKQDWILKKFNHLKNIPVYDAVANLQGYKKYKEQALLLTKERLEHFNRFYGFKYNKISIKQHKSRWGSCSRKGNLNFNYKVALLPAIQSDYIFVHELCHLQEFNHSSRFWDLVGKTIPNYKQIRRDLKKTGLTT